MPIAAGCHSVLSALTQEPQLNETKRALVTGTLEEAIARHELDVAPEQVDQLRRYCELLWAWNEKLNLTRHLDFEKFVARDLIDSMQLAEFLQSKERVLDIGSGGGVPGMVIAILRPDVKIWLSDSLEKKTNALTDMVRELELPCKVINSRVQDLLKKRKFDTLVARAVGPMSKLLGWVAPHWSQFDRLLLIKGPRWVEERGEARHRGLLKTLELRKLKGYPMPGTESESVILSIGAESNTS